MLESGMEKGKKSWLGQRQRCNSPPAPKCVLQRCNHTVKELVFWKVHRKAIPLLRNMGTTERIEVPLVQSDPLPEPAEWSPALCWSTEGLSSWGNLIFLLRWPCFEHLGFHTHHTCDGTVSKVLLAQCYSKTDIGMGLLLWLGAGSVPCSRKNTAWAKHFRKNRSLSVQF